MLIETLKFYAKKRDIYVWRFCAFENFVALLVHTIYAFDKNFPIKMRIFFFFAFKAYFSLNYYFKNTFIANSAKHASRDEIESSELLAKILIFLEHTIRDPRQKIL